MRCYDGCPDSELQAWIDARIDARKRLAAVNPRAHITYFPYEAMYSVWLDHTQITNDHDDLICAANEGIAVLIRRNNEGLNTPTD